MYLLNPKTHFTNITSVIYTLSLVPNSLGGRVRSVAWKITPLGKVINVTKRIIKVLKSQMFSLFICLATFQILELNIHP